MILFRVSKTDELKQQLGKRFYGIYLSEERTIYCGFLGDTMILWYPNGSSIEEGDFHVQWLGAYDFSLNLGEPWIDEFVWRKLYTLREVVNTVDIVNGMINNTDYEQWATTLLQGIIDHMIVEQHPDWIESLNLDGGRARLKTDGFFEKRKKYSFLKQLNGASVYKEMVSPKAKVIQCLVAAEGDVTVGEYFNRYIAKCCNLVTRPLVVDDPNLGHH